MATKQIKKLSDLQKITTATGDQMIPVVDASGNVNPIKLTDLAQVVAGLIGGNNSKLNALTLENKRLKYIVNNLSSSANWDEMYEGLFLLYPMSCLGSNPFKILGGNQAVVLQILPLNNQFCRQFAFTFGSGRIATRSRVKQVDETYKWSEWEIILNSATHIVRNKFKILSNNILPSILPCQKIHLT